VPRVRLPRLRAPRVELASVRRRLELLLKALHARDFTIVADDTPAQRWFEKYFSDLRDPSRSPEPVPRVDVTCIVLPPFLPVSDVGATGAERYRLLAIAAAERLTRGTLDAHAELQAPFERELFWVREGALIDTAIVQRMPALSPLVGRARERLLAARPDLARLTPPERVVEEHVQAALRMPPEQVPATFAAGESVHDSVDWARAIAASVASLPHGFAGTAPVGHWGLCPHDPLPRPAPNSMTLPGIFDGGVEIETRDETAAQRADPEGTAASQEPDDTGREDAAGAGIGDAYDSNRRYPRRRGTPHRYAEWDDRRHRYVPDAVTVWTEAASSGAEASVGEQPVVSMSRQLRRQFEQLRVQRTVTRRQFSGDALDFAALTDALVDLRMGRTPDERVYREERTNRHTLAIGVLADISGSTATPLSDGARVIDVERQALLMAHEALEALGDPYALFAFAGLGAHDVQVFSIKAFDERGRGAPGRIHALQPDQNTRLGAAIRHVSQVLGAQSATHQLLLVMTDGRPNDVGYHEEHAVADSRRAVLDARNRGTAVFGLAIDFEDHAYLAQIFGASGYVYVRDPHALGRQLLRSIASLVRG
jgi:nitric oxide reductase NorD protein